jgi:hypothetical protein
MFGFAGMPDLTEMVRQVEDWKLKLERLVQAMEKMQRDVEVIKTHLGIEEKTEFSLNHEAFMKEGNDNE